MSDILNDMEIKEKIDYILEEINSIGRLENKPTIFTIANTKKYDNAQMYFPPIRDTIYGVAGNVVVFTVDQAKKVASYVNGKVDYVLVDAEKKILKSEYGTHDAGNVERTVFEIVDKSKVYSFKANDLTVDAIDCFISQFKKPLSITERGKNVAIIGAGNIGSKLALSIVERGVNVKIYRRNIEHSKKIADALNIIKTGELLAKVESSANAVEACTNCDIVIGATPGTPGINKECVDVMKEGGLIIDVGKGSIEKDAIPYAVSKGITVIRADVRAGFEAALCNIFNTVDLIENIMGSRKIDGITVVSGGIMGEEGDVVVDNYKKPRRVVGIANGHGDIKRKITDEDYKKLEIIKKHLIVK